MGKKLGREEYLNRLQQCEKQSLSFVCVFVHFIEFLSLGIFTSYFFPFCKLQIDNEMKRNGKRTHTRTYRETENMKLVADVEGKVCSV